MNPGLVLPPILITPTFLGADGLSCLSREVTDALSAIAKEGLVEVWSLSDSAPMVASPRARLFCAGGSRSRFASWGLKRTISNQQGRVIVCLHTHLVPVALPMVARGAELTHVLVGIESWKAASAFQSIALRRSTRLLAISRHTASEFRKANPAFEAREIIVCHPGLPIGTAGVAAAPDGPYALIVGRMSSEERYKGHDVLIDVWSEVRRRAPGARLVVAGEGDDRKRLETKVIDRGLSGAIEFVGFQSNADLERLYRECAFFVMPSSKEGFGLVFLEAMRAAKGCVGAKGAASELIVDGETGFVVDPENHRELIEAIVGLWSSRTLRRDFGVRSRERFIRAFTAEHFHARLLAALRYSAGA